METQSSSNPTQVINQQFDPKEVEKGRKIINSDLITPDGRSWLVRALDPFHDEQVKPVGYPDLDISASVVQEINMSMTITCPPTITTGTWDCHVFNMCDFAAPTEDLLNDTVSNMYFDWRQCVASGLGGIQFGDSGVVAICVPTGRRMFPTGTTAVISTDCTTSHIQPGQYIKDRCRLVGGGFEVTNTTAPLYQQGLVTAYRLPQVDAPGIVAMQYKDSGGSSTNSHTSSLIHTLPPGTVAEALVLPASKQWPASRGCYSVMALNNMENPFRGIDSRPRLYLEATAPDSILVGSNSRYVGGVTSKYNTTGAFPGDFVMNAAYSTPFNTSGAFFTGLSTQTTLQVNAKWIVESVPNPRSAFATLAIPSPMYDAEALRLYSQMVARLPVGVPVDENPDGEWFESILGSLGELADMASFIHPAFGAIGKGLKVARTVVPGLVNSFNGTKPHKQQQQNGSKSKSPLKKLGSNKSLSSKLLTRRNKK